MPRCPSRCMKAMLLGLILCTFPIAVPQSLLCYENSEAFEWPPPGPPADATLLLQKGTTSLLDLAPAQSPTDAVLRQAIHNVELCGPTTRLHILNPLSHGFYPNDIAAPHFHWEPGPEETRSWLVHILFPDGSMAYALTRVPEWTPDEMLWATIKQRTAGNECRFTVTALDTKHRGTAQGLIFFGISTDPLDAAIFYQQIPLPFLFAQAHPELSRWLIADPTVAEPPRIVFGGMRHCGNCHTFSNDAEIFGMDIDYDKDKGGYVLMPVSERMTVGEAEMISWNSYRPDDGRISMGLFTKLSPDGSHAVTTVKEKSMFSPLEDLEFCQFFYPIRGHLAVYSKAERSIQPLPGADDEAYVQTSPAWSPDGERIVFARAPLDQRLIETMGDRAFLPPGEELIDDLNEKYPYRFDLYTLDFNTGKGGTPSPLRGASNNGASNYFPRFSPDGRWIVYCRSETGLVLQPSSKLWIIPATGGEARELECNTDFFNSWHSFTPNGRWLIFSTKQNTPYTEVFAAHLDTDGTTSRPVLLDRLSHPRMASIIPEATNRSILQIQRIELQRP